MTFFVYTLMIEQSASRQQVRYAATEDVGVDFAGGELPPLPWRTEQRRAPLAWTKPGAVPQATERFVLMTDGPLLERVRGAAE
ncbi:hypothetical protein [Nocardioides mangrovi]|uniref:Uncharacterized protein n=1 Tax=Nocardioides mangrovi TaxID=2874580 RepID=A0ABS7UIC2_9ACTN|nr:hypothetical protein [Nocardioides mangrovi]MBZ5740779.1 hypothetical protein [Nocardioides mangrovi]